MTVESSARRSCKNASWTSGLISSTLQRLTLRSRKSLPLEAHPVSWFTSQVLPPLLAAATTVLLAAKIMRSIHSTGFAMSRLRKAPASSIGGRLNSASSAMSSMPFMAKECRPALGAYGDNELPVKDRQKNPTSGRSAKMLFQSSFVFEQSHLLAFYLHNQRTKPQGL